MSRAATDLFLVRVMSAICSAATLRNIRKCTEQVSVLLKSNRMSRVYDPPAVPLPVTITVYRYM